MRKILFRGKSPISGEWFYGYYKEGDVNEDCGEIWENYNTYTVVYKNTVGEYTGLNDCKGVKIFEGDIIKFIDDYGFIRKCGVEVENGLFMTFGGYDDLLYNIVLNYDDVEIIGNISDNPELAEEIEDDTKNKVWRFCQH